VVVRMALRRCLCCDGGWREAGDNRYKPVPVTPYSLNDRLRLPRIANRLANLTQTIPEGVFLVVLMRGAGPELLQ
jgi:hypothetical protein